MRTLQKKLALILTGLAVACVLLSSWILTAFDRYHFQEYINQNRQLRNERIAAVLGQAYERHSGWTQDTGVDIGKYSAQEGLSIRLLDAGKQPVWQFAANSPQPVDSVSSGQHMQPHWEKQLAASDLIEINSHGKTVGFAEVAYVDPTSYTALDFHYRQGMTQGLVSAIVPVILLGLTVSLLLSRRITQPLTNMIGLARQMRAGRLDVRVQTEKGGDELAQLAQAESESLEIRMEPADVADVTQSIVQQMESFFAKALLYFNVDFS